MKNNLRALSWIPALSMLLSVACGIIGPDGPDDPDNPDNPDIPAVVEDNYFDKSCSLSGEEYEIAGAQTVMRALELCYSTEKLKITKNGKSIYYSVPSAATEKFIDDFYSTLEQLAYSPDMSTRGLWSIGKSTVDWAKALNNTEKIYRCAIVGAVTENFNKDQMVELYNVLMKNKTDIFRDWMGLKYVSDKFEKENFSTAGRFWYHFSHGDLDSYARRIYDVIFNPQTLSDCFVMTDPLHELAFQLAANDLSPNRLMLSAAGPLLEAGFNTLFASDDLAGYAKLGYDILNDNTQLILDLKNEKLNTKTLMSAVNNNLNLLATCIDKVVGFDNLTGIKDTQDLGSVITGFCVDNGLDVTLTLKDLNNVISETLTDMGKWTLHVNDLSYKYFEQEVRKILGLDAEYECPAVYVYVQTYTSYMGNVFPFDDFAGTGYYSVELDQVTVKKSGDKTLRIEASYTETTVNDIDDIFDDGTYTTTKTLSFDLENFVLNKPESCVIKNFYVAERDQFKGTGRHSSDYYDQNFVLGIEQLPYLNDKTDYTFKFGGTAGSGINVTQFLDSNESIQWGESYPYAESTYVYNKDNSFSVSFNLVRRF